MDIQAEKMDVLNILKAHNRHLENKLLKGEKSKTRAGVEHVFGFMEQSMNKLYINSIGIQRASGFVGLVNLTCNLFRYEQITRINGIVMSNWQILNLNIF